MFGFQSKGDGATMISCSGVVEDSFLAPEEEEEALSLIGVELTTSSSSMWLLAVELEMVGISLSSESSVKVRKGNATNERKNTFHKSVQRNWLKSFRL